MTTADESHIAGLSQAVGCLCKLPQMFEESVWVSVISNWKQLYVLLMESLCAKHGIEKPSLPQGKVVAEKMELLEVCNILPFEIRV